MLQRTVTAISFTKSSVGGACERCCVELHYLLVPEKFMFGFMKPCPD